MTDVIADEADLPYDWIPRLCPYGINDNGTVQVPCDTNHNRTRSAFFFQFFVTFIFVAVILVNKGQYSTPTNDGVLKPLVVVLVLYGCINMSVKQGGAVYNPAVTLA